MIKLGLEPEPLAFRVGPLAQECFDSWIERVAAAHETNRAGLFRHLGIDAKLAGCDLARGAAGVAPEHQMAVRQMVGQLAWALQIEPQCIEGTFIDVDSAALLPRCLRHFVCAWCWQEAHRAGRSMIIRKEWVLRMSWWCHLHDRPLSMAATPGDQATDRELLSWLGKALPNAESLRWGLDYRPAMIARNALCLDQRVRSGRRRMKGRNRDYFDRFLANQYHFTHDRIAMLALAHSHVGRAVWGFEQLVARGLAECSGANVESLKQPKSARRAKVRWRTRQGRAQGRIVNVELLSVLRAYAQLQDRRMSRAWAQSRFGHFPIIGP